jgi:hypothetical protein
MGFRVKESITCPESFPAWENAKAGQIYINSIKSFRTGKELNDYFFTSFKNVPLPSKIRSFSSTRPIGYDTRRTAENFIVCDLEVQICDIIL